MKTSTVVLLLGVAFLFMRQNRIVRAQQTRDSGEPMIDLRDWVAYPSQYA